MHECLARRGWLKTAHRHRRNDELMWLSLPSGCRKHAEVEVYAAFRRKAFSEFAPSKAAVLMRNIYSSNMRKEMEAG